MLWIHTPVPAGDAEELSKRAGIGPVVAELLVRAGLAEPEAAAERLKKAIQGREKLVVLGDYDVDGVSSTALLVLVLRRFGLDPKFVVPRRSEDGYGLSRSAIDRALEAGKPKLFIALDCGTNSHDEAAYLQAQGVDVIIIDHHRAKENEEPVDGLLINPHAHPRDGDEAWRNLCTVGLVFKLAHGLLKPASTENHP